MTASGGIVNLARLAGVPVVPIVFATSRRRVVRSGDRFHLALPFGRGVFLWGEPIAIARDLDPEGIEGARLLIERRMNDLARDADRRVGRREQTSIGDPMIVHDRARPGHPRDEPGNFVDANGSSTWAEGPRAKPGHERV